MSQHGKKFQKYKKYKDQDIYPHKHCPVCKKMVPEEGSEFGEYCSPECAGVPKHKKKKNRKRIIFIIVGYVVMFGVLIGLTFILQKKTKL